MTRDALELGRAWRNTFLLEVPICLGTAAYWLFGGAQFIQQTWGIAADAAHLGLLRMQAGVIVSLLVWFYGRWLLAGVRDLRGFRLFQEGLAVGDVFIVAGAAYAASRGEISAAMAWAQIVPAVIWLVVRVVFLWRVRA